MYLYLILQSQDLKQFLTYLQSACLAATYTVIKPPVLFLNQILDCFCKVLGVGGSAVLIINDIQLFPALLKLLHDLLDKLLILIGTCAHHPPCAANEISLGILYHKPFSHILGARIYTQRIGLVPIIVKWLIPVKDTGSTNVQQRNIQGIGNVNRIFNT